MWSKPPKKYNIIVGYHNIIIYHIIGIIRKFVNIKNTENHLSFRVNTNTILRRYNIMYYRMCVAEK